MQNDSDYVRTAKVSLRTCHRKTLGQKTGVPLRVGSRRICGHVGIGVRIGIHVRRHRIGWRAHRRHRVRSAWSNASRRRIDDRRVGFRFGAGRCSGGGDGLGPLFARGEKRSTS